MMKAFLRVLELNGGIMDGLVSIVMPSYNCEKFIAESIESVQAQTYREWELLIVDDCSTDCSVQIVQQYALNDKRIKIYQNNKNSGAAISRNYALQEARGRWIAFLDSDDLWVKTKLEKQIEFMEENNYHFSFTSYTQVDEEGKELHIRMTGPKSVGKIKIHMFNFFGCLSVMYDAKATGLIQIANLKKRNDYAIWLKVSKYAKAYLLDEDLAVYRVRSGNSLSDRNKGMSQWLEYHYKLFRIGQGYNSVTSAFLTVGNVFFYEIKKLLYQKKY